MKKPQSSVYTGFSAFDDITHGLRPAEPYLVYGAQGLGKGAFALGFISEGLANGEVVALVTSQSPEKIIEQARSYGLDLAPGLEDNRLFLFEYPEDIAGTSSRLLDDLRIVEEFRTALAGASVERVVFHPVTPLLNGPTQSFVADRFQVIANSIRSMDATALYLVDMPEGQAKVPAVRDAVHGVLRFEERRDGRYLVLESMPECTPGEEIRYQLEPGLGLRTPSAGGLAVVPPSLSRATRTTMDLAALTVSQAAQQQAATILVIDPDESQSAMIQAALGPAFRILSAAGAADGLPLLSLGGPQLLIVSEQVRGGAGIDIVRKVRGTGRNLPILLVSNRLRRVSDEAAFLAAGVDVFLKMPAERSLVRPSVWNLLRRSGVVEFTARNGHNEFESLASEVNCTGDLDYFIARVLHDNSVCQRFGATPCLIVMHVGRHLLDELASVAALFTRSADLVFTGERGIVVLLSGAGEKFSFLERFRRNWKGSAAPFIDEVAASGAITDAGLRSLIAEGVGVRHFELEKKRAISSSH